MTTIETLDTLIKTSQGFDEKKTDFYGSAAPLGQQTYSFEFTLGCELAPINKLTSVESPAMPLTDSAWGQTAEKLGVALYPGGGSKTLGKKFVDASRQHKDNAVVKAFSGYLNALMVSNQRDWFVRSYDGQIRAVLSPRYAPVSNTEMLQTAKRALEMQAEQGVKIDGYEFSRPVITPDDMHIQIIVRGLDPKDPLGGTPGVTPMNGTPGGMPYGIGFYMRNNETGSGGIEVMPVLKRGACDNSIIIPDGRQRMKAIHVGARGLILSDMSNAMADALAFTEEYLIRFLNARTVEIPNFDKVISAFAESNGWNGEQIAAVSRGSEGQQTVYGLVNGVSFMAHAATANHDDRITAEKLAGSILHKPRDLFPKQEWVTVYEAKQKERVAVFA